MDHSKSNRNLVIGLSLLIMFILLIISISLYFNYQHDIKYKSRIVSTDIEGMNIDEVKTMLDEKQNESNDMLYIFYLIPVVGLIGLLIGTIVYYMMSDKLLRQDKYLKKNTKVILNFLSNNEKKVIETLIENKGKVPQYELSHLPDMNKLKTHRLLSNLEQKGIIHKEKLGKINKIVLNKELYDVLM